MVSFVQDSPQLGQHPLLDRGNQSNLHYPNMMGVAGQRPMQQPRHGFGFPPQPHPMFQQQPPMGLFNNNLFMQTQNASVDIVNAEQVLFVKNYQRLEELSEDKELNKLYFSNPDYVWQLFHRHLSDGGTWLYEAYAVFNRLSSLVITTPHITLRVDKDNAKFYYDDYHTKAMTDEQITKGLLPVLKMIENVYTVDEEIKRQAELDRLKQREVKEKSASEETAPKSDQKKEYIRLKHRQIKNSKSNYSTFLKTIDKAESNLSRFLHGSVPSIRYMLDCFIDNCYGPCSVNGVTLYRDDHDCPVVVAGDLKIQLTPTNTSPMLQLFEYADLRDENLIESTIMLCKQLAIIDSSI